MKKRKSNGTPSGFRDLLPQNALLKSWVVKKISEVYQKWGFFPIETPLVEFYETLTGEVTDFNLYKVNPSKERKVGIAKELALRFDQTVPLARFIVDHSNEITLPFKRYVYGPVFRGETPQAGRYRQFDQFDIDIVGSSSITSDIEILLCMHETMQNVVGEGNFIIKANTRKLLNCLPKIFNFSESILSPVLIELDKRDKIEKNVLLDSIMNLGIKKENAEKLIEFGDIAGTPFDVINKIKTFTNESPESLEAITDLEQVASTLNICGIKEIIFDMSIIRGLAYYTGMVFETSLLQAKEFGSVYSGGRYDGLVESFGVQAIPAVGASVGVDRLVTALESIGFNTKSSLKRFIVLRQEASKDITSYMFSVANIFRSMGFICEVYTGNNTKKLKDQFIYSASHNYDYVLIIGNEEVLNKTIRLKDQKTRTEKVLNLFSFKEGDLL